VIGAGASTQGDWIKPQVDRSRRPLQGRVTGYTLYDPVMKDMNNHRGRSPALASYGWRRRVRSLAHRLR
jgi:hypothetical protein